MGYEKNKNENGKWTGKWYFSKMIKGHRCRETMNNISQSEVEYKYSNWLSNIQKLIDNNENKIFLLYEKFDEFLEWCKNDKNEHRYNKYIKAISTFKEFIKDMELKKFIPAYVEDYIA